jgi:hypothetical protein
MSFYWMVHGFKFEYSRLKYSALTTNCFAFSRTVYNIYLYIRSITLAVPHKKHITSPLRAQQVNAIYRFVTMVY